MLAALLHAKSAKPDHFKSLRFCASGGEPLPEAVADGYRERFNVIINEGYGLTETSPVTNWCRPQDYRPKSVGMAVPRVEGPLDDGRADGGRAAGRCVEWYMSIVLASRFQSTPGIAAGRCAS